MGILPLLYAFCLKQKPLQTSEKRLTAVVLAPPARLELTTFRLGGGPSIPVRYGGLYNKYSIFGLNRIRTNCRLGGGRSIQLSYSDISTDENIPVFIGFVTYPFYILLSFSATLFSGLLHYFYERHPRGLAYITQS